MDKRGFTLVEVIIILVILAILAAVLIPTLGGYMDKARDGTIISECRYAVESAQTISSEKYAKEGGGIWFDSVLLEEARALAELPGKISTIDYTDEHGRITHLLYLAKNGKYCLYCSKRGINCDCTGTAMYTIRERSTDFYLPSAMRQQLADYSYSLLYQSIQDTAAKPYTGSNNLIKDFGKLDSASIDKTNADANWISRLYSFLDDDLQEYLDSTTFLVLKDKTSGSDKKYNTSKIFFTDTKNSTSAKVDAVIWEYDPATDLYRKCTGTVSNGMIDVQTAPSENLSKYLFPTPVDENAWVSNIYAETT